MNSIRHRLLISLLLGLLICTISIMILAYLNARSEFRELSQENIRQMALVLKEQVFHQPDTTQDRQAAIDREESFVFQLWDNQGHLIQSSPIDIAIPLQPEGKHTISQAANESWRIFTMHVPEKGYIQVAQPASLVETIVAESAAKAILPFILLLIVLSSGAWVIIGRSLKPLKKLSTELENRKPELLNPLSLDDVPDEVQVLVHALNGLLSRLNKLIEAQRQFTADAAHELRTPLTAVNLQLQLLKRAETPEDQKDAINSLSQGLDRCTHLVNQMLDASRASRLQNKLILTPINLSAVITSMTMEMESVAEHKAVTITLQIPATCLIQGDEEGLRSMVGNLIDNAIRYSPKGGRVNVFVTNTKDETILEVIDTGPGIPADQHQRVFERFYRIPGTKGIGSGLGLSIVKDIADQHGAIIDLLNNRDGSGITFRVKFPQTSI